MNVQQTLNMGENWTSATIDFFSPEYSMYKNVSIFCSNDNVGCILSVMTSQDSSDSFKTILEKNFPTLTYSATVKIVSRFMKIRVQNFSMQALNISVHCRFETEDRLLQLADKDGCPISADNPLQTFSEQPPTIKIFDSAGQAITTNGDGSLNVNITSQPSNNNVLYGISGNPIQTFNDRLVVDVNTIPDLGCYVRNQPNVNISDSYGAVIDAGNPLHVRNDRNLNISTDSVVALLGDSNGQYINSSNNNLNVALFDSNNNALTTANGGLNVNVSNNVFNARLYDANNSPLNSVDGKLTVQQTNLNAVSDSVQANMYASNGVELHQTMNSLNVYNTSHLNSAYDSVVAKIEDSAGNSITSTANSLNVHNTNNLSALTDSVKSIITNYSTGDSLDVSDNKLCVWVENQQNNNIFDSSGNPIHSTNSSLNVYNVRHNNYNVDSMYSVLGNPNDGGYLDVSDNKISVWVANPSSDSYSFHASNGDTITAIDGKLMVQQVNINSATDSIQSNLFDGSGNGISSIDGALNVKQANLSASSDIVSANLCDGVGSPISSTDGALNINFTRLNHSVDNVKSYLFDGSGNSILSTRGALHTDDYMTSVALGQYSNMVYRKVMGYRAVVDASGEDITTLTATAYNVGAFPAMGIGLYLNSTSVNDTLISGTGATQILLTVQTTTTLTGNGTTTTAVNLNGTSNVSTSLTNIRRIVSMQVVNTGYLLTNVGTITAYTVGTNIPVCNILPNNTGTSILGIYSTYNFTALVKRIYYQCSNPCNIYIKMKLPSFGGWYLSDCIMNATGNGYKDVLINVDIMQDIKVYAVAVSASASVGFQMDVIEFI